MEHIVACEHIYPSQQLSATGLFFDDQYTFWPTGLTTAALTKLFHDVTNMLETNPYMIVYAIVFSKALRHRVAR
jgi:hypothetical protein